MIRFLASVVLVCVLSVPVQAFGQCGQNGNQSCGVPQVSQGNLRIAEDLRLAQNTSAASSAASAPRAQVALPSVQFGQVIGAQVAPAPQVMIEQQAPVITQQQAPAYYVVQQPAATVLAAPAPTLLAQSGGASALASAGGGLQLAQGGCANGSCGSARRGRIFGRNKSVSFSRSVSRG